MLECIDCGKKVSEGEYRKIYCDVMEEVFIECLKCFDLVKESKYWIEIEKGGE